ncbi:nuclear transport factor 2 family protein [Mycobacterium sp. ACS4331]|uniref:nuclear transport factor 2 family protein n=1 Tax=Mycobacterium sp. ACS4331 TaxID=1834121 RepID=UPI0007FB8A29|nr:nuclear transport factor 2 family protein [Mycobacterium sp. ACS4331]OBF16247.1 polyketide cyclase [Mycobacterium sp. ACS4331]
MRTAREVVELYNLELWNNQRYDLVDEIIADTMVRHEVGESHTLTRADARKRVEDMWEQFESLTFVLNTVIADEDGQHVAIIYDSTIRAKDGSEFKIASIEVFKVVDGRITEVWNCGYGQGVWS